jgi:hypothetical protein
MVTMSRTAHTLSETPAAIAGVTFRLLWMRQKQVFSERLGGWQLSTKELHCAKRIQFLWLSSARRCLSSLLKSRWEGDRGTKALPDVGKHLVFSFLTTDASPDVAPIHPDATPVLLLDEGAREMWMNAPWELVQSRQRPPSAGALKIVAYDTKQDSG